MPQLSPMFWSMFPSIMNFVLMVFFSVLFWWCYDGLMINEKDDDKNFMQWLW